MIELYFNEERLTPSQKRDILFGLIECLCNSNSINSDIIEDWFCDSLSKKKAEDIKDIYETQTIVGSILRLFDEDLPIVDKGGHMEWIVESRINSRNDFLKLIGITPRKIDDLFVSISFNIKIEEMFSNENIKDSLITFSSAVLKNKMQNITRP